MADIVRRRNRPLSRMFNSPFRRLFEDFFEGLDRDSELPELWSESRFVPAIDVSETEGTVTVSAEVPGMSKEDLDVTVDNGVLTLRGEKTEERTEEEADYHRVERRYGQFERRLRLPQYVDADQIDATYKDGVLKLTIPKSEEAKTKSIEIK